ncbi:MAG: rhomboid family intramembrane serine protease [Bacteroidetes bacterium]|nr:rhomboid family intramembrane serine protease [Bacteroidota bacterium]
MAFKLNPKHQLEIELDGLSPQEFKILATETLKKLDWDLSKNSADSLIAYTKMSMSSWSEEISIHISESKAVITSRCTGTQLVDWGKNKENTQTFAEMFAATKAEITPESLKELVEAAVIPEQQHALSMDQADKKAGLLSLVVPREGYFVTPILVGINLLVFLLMVISGAGIMAPSGESLINWGANFRPVTLDGGWWRLITSCFIHIGLFHVLMNMYALLYIGLLLEPLLGRWRFIRIYLVTGIAASAASLWWNDITISAGASGAIFGMYGVFLSMLTTNLIEKSARKALMTSIVIFVLFNLLSGAGGGVDNAAHIGGLLSGILIGYLLYPSLRYQKTNQLSKLAESAAIVIPILFCAWSYFNTSNDLAKYDASMLAFQQKEVEALSVFELPDTAATETFLYELNESGIVVWNECIDLVKQMDELDIPASLHEQNEKLLDYCIYRIHTFRLISSAIQENTTVYDDSIQYYNTEIEAVLASISGE